MFKAIQNFAKAQPVIFTVVLLLIVGIIIYFIGRKSGKDATPPLPPPIGPEGQKFQPASLTDALAREMLGFNWTPRNEKPFQELMIIPDWQFIEVAKDWQNRYFPEAKLTLIQQIGSEVSAWASFRMIRDQIVQRAAKLGIV